MTSSIQLLGLPVLSPRSNGPTTASQTFRETSPAAHSSEERELETKIPGEIHTWMIRSVPLSHEYLLLLAVFHMARKPRAPLSHLAISREIVSLNTRDDYNPVQRPVHQAPSFGSTSQPYRDKSHVFVLRISRLFPCVSCSHRHARRVQQPTQRPPTKLESGLDQPGRSSSVENSAWAQKCRPLWSELRRDGTGPLSSSPLVAMAPSRHRCLRIRPFACP